MSTGEAESKDSTENVPEPIRTSEIPAGIMTSSADSGTDPPCQSLGLFQTSAALVTSSEGETTCVSNAPISTVPLIMRGLFAKSEVTPVDSIAETLPELIQGEFA